ncbi:MAG: hypothetical protein PHN60_01230 [Candidatus Gracilibacteria bacterium]|nr:hypothetical protein [Candidatus Gracilibacteria bacterium]
MPKEQNSSYVMSEEISHSEKQENSGEEHNSGEVLKSFHHKVSHLDAMIKKVNSIEKNSIENTDTVNILNALLQKSKLGGSNGGKENKAYFKKHEGQIMLVLNTVVNGVELKNSQEDIEKVLTKVDELFIKNPLSGKSSPERKEISAEEKIRRANKRLTQYEHQIEEINNSYREDINDWFMIRDAVVEATGGESGKKIYEENIQSIQKNIEKDYKTLLASFEGKELSADDAKKLAFYKKQTEILLGKKLGEMQSFAGYLITEKKLDSAKNALYGVKGIGIGMIEGFTEGIIFAFLFLTNPELRDTVYASVESFYDYLKENYSDYEKLWGDFLKKFEEGLKEIQGLPEKQQAEAVGKIFGNAIVAILGAKGMNAVIKSGKARLKFKQPETSDQNIKFKATGKTESSKDFTSKKQRKRASEKLETKTPKKIITAIGEVKNWDDLESFVNTIDRVRFKEGLTGKKIQEIINGVRGGTRSIKDIPNYGGIREIVDTLKRNGGVMPEAIGIEKVMQATGKIVGTGMEKIQDALPFKEARKFLHKNILTGYDSIDIRITKLRTLTNETILHGLNDIARITHFKKIEELTAQIIDEIKVVSFPGKEGLLNKFKKLRSSLTEKKENIEEKVEHYNKEYLTKEGYLTEKEFRTLRFEEGFAIREIERNGKTFYEYRDVNGKKVFEEYIYASHFKDGQAAVTKIENGKEINFIIDKKGKIISEHTESSFTSIQRFSNGGYRIFDGESYQLKYSADHKNNKSQEYAFMTEIRGNMVIGVDKKNGVKYIINQDGKRFKTPFHYIDDFTESGVAAVKESTDGNWLLIDREGNLLKRDGSILRKNEDIITKNKNGDFIDGKGNIKTEKEKLQQEEEFEIIGYNRNLESIKTHMENTRKEEKKIQKKEDPEMLKRKREADTLILSTILKKNDIHSTGSFVFSYTEKEGLILYKNPHTKGIQVVDLKKGIISKESFSSIHTPDIVNGYIRVCPANNKEIMGVINLDGEYIVSPKYMDIQILDEKKKLFEVSEMRKIGESLNDGTIIEKSFSDNLRRGDEMVKRIGLINGRGKMVIETGYTEITLLDEKTAQGFIRGEKHEILKRSKRYDTYEALTNVASSSNKTVAMTAVLVAESPMVIENIRKSSINITRSETSTVISELKNNKLSLSTNRISTIRDIQTFEMEIEKIVHEEVNETVRGYLERNGFPKLTKEERIEVATHEKETRKKLIEAIRLQVKSEQIPSKNKKSQEGGGLVSTLVKSLHPELYVSLGGKAERLLVTEKVA